MLIEMLIKMLLQERQKYKTTSFASLTDTNTMAASMLVTNLRRNVSVKTFRRWYPIQDTVNKVKLIMMNYLYCIE